MICKYFQVIHIIIEKIIIGNTQPGQDVLGTSPEGILKVLKSGIYRGPSGDSQGTNKKWWFYEKFFLRSNSPCICFWFLHEEQIFKSSKRGHPRDVYGTQLREVPGTKWWDVLGTFVRPRSNMFFKFNSRTHNSYLAGYSRLYSEW